MLQKLLELLIGKKQEKINGSTQNKDKTAIDSYNETLYESEINKQSNAEFQDMNEKECINIIEEQKEKQDINTNIIDTNLFKNEQETKEEKIKEVLQLEHDIAVEEEYEFPPIELLNRKEEQKIIGEIGEREKVYLREIIDTNTFSEYPSSLAVALGKNMAGQEIVFDISKMPHMLLGGSTGSGKSICIHTLITSIIYKAKPSEVKLIMIDSSGLELPRYNGIPHLLIPVITDSKKAIQALAWAIQEMENRYVLFANECVRNIEEYNEVAINKLPHIAIIIDEIADLIIAGKKDVEEVIFKLSQKAQKVGMHLIISTQRPSGDIITGTIKANIPSRIAFKVTSQINSRIILDEVGAEKLLGKGDMLFYPAGVVEPIRVQGAYISTQEIGKIIDFVKSDNSINYDIIKEIEEVDTQEQEEDDDETDPFLMEAIEVVVETGQASTGFIQRRFKVGYARAGRIMDQMEERGVISGFQGSKPREVLMSEERWKELKSSSK